jgi:ketosteroid isomerase-like protein
VHSQLFDYRRLSATLPIVPTRPEQVHPALAAAYNAGDLEGMLALYDPRAVLVIKPGRVTAGPAELRAALSRLVEIRGHLTVHPDSFVRSDDLVLALGKYILSGRRRGGTPFEVESRFADVLRRKTDGRWLVAVDNGFNRE